MALQKQKISVVEFEAFTLLPENADKILELIDGEIIEVPSNVYSSEISSTVIIEIGIYLKQNRIGRLTGENGGYLVAGARLAPDVAFIAHGKRFTKTGYNPDPPDLAVEVVSPTDEEAVLQKKLLKYAEAGVMVWVMRPQQRYVEVHAPGQPMRVVNIDGVLDGGDVLPGFTLAVKDIFPDDVDA